MNPAHRFPDDSKVVLVSQVRVDDLPEEMRRKAGDAQTLFGLHAPTGEVLALLPDRETAIVVARRNDLQPVTLQ